MTGKCWVARSVLERRPNEVSTPPFSRVCSLCLRRLGTFPSPCFGSAVPSPTAWLSPSMEIFSFSQDPPNCPPTFKLAYPKSFLL